MTTVAVTTMAVTVASVLLSVVVGVMVVSTVVVLGRVVFSVPRRRAVRCDVWCGHVHPYTSTAPKSHPARR